MLLTLLLLVFCHAYAVDDLQGTIDCKRQHISGAVNFPKMNWCIYYDEGVAGCSFQALQNLLMFLQQNVDIIDAQEVARGYWLTYANVFVLPGGQARFFRLHLQEPAQEMIKTFLTKGGKVLAFCGGGYYFSKISTFNPENAACYLGRRMHDVPFYSLVESETYLFPGVCKGPYTLEQSVELTVHQDLKLPFKCFRSTTLGGGSFVEYDCSENIKVLAQYASGEAAVVMGHIGLGSYILAGPHIEMIDCQLYCVEREKNSISLGSVEKQYLFFVQAVMAQLSNKS